MRDSLLDRLLGGRSDASIRFEALTMLLKRLGFSVRIKGSHHIFFHPEVEEILNLQPHGNLAKPYQVKQVRKVVIRYKMAESSQ